MEETTMMEQTTEVMENNDVQVNDMPPMEIPNTCGSGKVALIAGTVVLVGAGIALGYKKGKKWLKDRKARKGQQADDENVVEEIESEVVEKPEKEANKK